MGMASGVQDDLWRSVEDSNFGQYYRISEGMNLASSRREGRRQQLPVRLYIKRGRGTSERRSVIWDREQACLGVALADTFYAKLIFWLELRLHPRVWGQGIGHTDYAKAVQGGCRRGMIV